MGIIIILTVLICVSTKESSRVNLILVITKLVGVLFVIIVGARTYHPTSDVSVSTFKTLLCEQCV